MVFTGPMPAGFMERVRKPRPTNAMASMGEPAISPHTLKAIPCLLAARATSPIAPKNPCGHLEHPADLDGIGHAPAALALALEFPLQDKTRGVEFRDLRHHRKHDSERTSRARPQQRAHLLAQHRRTVK